MTFAYDINGYLASFTDPLSRFTSFINSYDGKLQTIRDARTNGQDIYNTVFSQTTQPNTIITTMTDPGSRRFTFTHNSNTGNLTKYQDQLGNSWLYSWTNNNLITVQDTKGKTTYEYDTRGNVTKKTTTVDSDPNNNIVQTMTYDDNNQLLELVDGSGRKTSYKYDNRGNLLSTSNPDIKESNGRKYDQYGNVVEYSPGLSSKYNLLKNGSFENSTNYWTRVPGSAMVSMEGCQLYGNSALKMSSSTYTTDCYYQRVSNLNSYDKLTLRADIKLDNVQSNPGWGGGVIIKLYYDSKNWEYIVCKGNGTSPLVLTSTVPYKSGSRYVDVYIGLYNASGTAWIDGVQLENMYQSGDGHTLSAFNLVEDSSFENSSQKWITDSTFCYKSNIACEGVRCGSLYHKGNSLSSFYQDVPVYGGESMTLSGMVFPSCEGTGAYLKVDYYDASNQIIPGYTVQTGSATGYQGWNEFTRLSYLAITPSQAKYARLQGVLDGEGGAYFDTIKLVHRNSEKYTYSSSGNYLTTSEDALGKQSRRTYNENTGTQLSFTDASNNATYYAYDNLNRLVGVTDPMSRHAYYEYDPMSNLTATRDPKSSGSTDNTYRTLFAHNNINQLNILTDPLSRNTSNTYDRSGNLTKVSLPNGLQINYTYDNANRLTRRILNNGKYYNYSYDGANNLIRVTDQDNKSCSWDYDGAGRVKYSTDTFNYRLDYMLLLTIKFRKFLKLNCRNCFQ